MNKWTYYNDSDSFVCEWTRNLIAAGLIPDGVVDCREIQKVNPDELRSYSQCHFFNGISGWPLALALAGWPSERPVWTASCPCQPLSCAGQRKGHADKRHLWPAFYALVAKCRPTTIFGEQVASKDGREWLAGIRADLEGIGYAVGAADLCAASVGAPQIRQRLYWVAVAQSEKRNRGIGNGNATGRAGLTNGCKAVGLVLSDRARRDSREQTSASVGHGSPAIATSGSVGMDNPTSARCESEGIWQSGESERGQRVPGVGRKTFWSDFSVIPVGADWKRISSEPGAFPLAARLPGDLAKLRAYGNAICVPLAVEFIEAVIEVIDAQK